MERPGMPGMHPMQPSGGGHPRRGGKTKDALIKWAPLFCTFVAALLMTIIVTSGMGNKTTENLAIVRFNTSRVGIQLINNAGNKACESVSGGVSKGLDFLGIDSKGADEAISNTCGNAIKITSEALADAQRSVARALGIHEYYSVHAGSLCWADYGEDKDDSDSDADSDDDNDDDDDKDSSKPRKIRRKEDKDKDGVKAAPIDNLNRGISSPACTPKFRWGYRPDLLRALDEGLQVGPFRARLADLRLARELLDALAAIPRAVLAMAGFLLAACSALALALACNAALVGLEHALERRPGGSRALEAGQRAAMLGALGGLAAGLLATAVAAVGVAAAAETVKKGVNEHGAAFGIAAETSGLLYGLLGAVVACAAVAFWALLTVHRRATRARRMMMATMGGAGAGAGMGKEASMSESTLGGGMYPPQGPGAAGNGDQFYDVNLSSAPGGGYPPRF
ncbi:hypothetical protein VTJ83DRAFT_4255 [Remersonia thermophila]|uniref:Uncharacterized protein n=1 Tax=Remersonia thermophila TaxID=72144 RepID=A0ABR4D9D0_9PEZI